MIATMNFPLDILLAELFANAAYASCVHKLVSMNSKTILFS